MAVSPYAFGPISYGIGCKTPPTGVWDIDVDGVGDSSKVVDVNLNITMTLITLMNTQKSRGFVIRECLASPQNHTLTVNPDSTFTATHATKSVNFVFDEWGQDGAFTRTLRNFAAGTFTGTTFNYSEAANPCGNKCVLYWIGDGSSWHCVTIPDLISSLTSTPSTPLVTEQNGPTYVNNTNCPAVVKYVGGGLLDDTLVITISDSANIHTYFWNTTGNYPSGPPDPWSPTTPAGEHDFMPVNNAPMPPILNIGETLTTKITNFQGPCGGVVHCRFHSFKP